MADQVTISTFLELRDNMSAGLQRVVDALQAVTKDTTKSQEAIAAQTTENARRFKRAKSDEEKAAKRAAEMRRRIEIASAKQASDAIQKEAEARIKAQHAADSFERTREMQRIIRSEQAAALAERQRVADAKRALAAQERMQRAAEAAAARAERQRVAEARREAREVANALRQIEAERARAARAAEALARREATARIREEARVEREARRLARETAAALARAHRERERQEKLDAAKPRGLFGTMVGANITAKLLTDAAYKVKDLTVDFFDKVKEEGAKYEKQTAAIAGSIFTRGIEKTYSQAEGLSRSLMGQMVELAAKLPGEASDYIEVFSRTLPSALSGGQKDMKQFVDFVSKYTALAVQQGKPATVAATQMVEILQGHVRTTTSMYQHLSQFTGKTSREWSNPKLLTAADRLRIAMEAVNKASAALPATALDAVSVFGTLKSAWDMMFVVEGSPLFESQKIAAKELTDLLASPMIKNTMSAIAEGVGNMLVGAIVFFRFLFENSAKFLSWTFDKISSLPGMGGIKTAFKTVSDLEAFVDPIRTMYRIGEEERAKWQAQKKPDITLAGGAAPAPLHTTPSDRTQTVNDFRYSRFDIRQEFAEGFDPDRIAVAFATDLGKLATARLQAATSAPAGAR